MYAGTGMLAFVFNPDGSCGIVTDPAAKCSISGNKILLSFSDEDEDLSIQSKTELVFDGDSFIFKQINDRIFKYDNNRAEHTESETEFKRINDEKNAE